MSDDSKEKARCALEDAVVAAIDAGLEAYEVMASVGYVLEVAGLVDPA